MGKVEFTGVSEAQAMALKERWALKTGQIFDQSYLDKFFRHDAGQVLSRIFQERGLMQKTSAPVETRYDKNREALTVDVTIEIKK